MFAHLIVAQYICRSDDGAVYRITVSEEDGKFAVSAEKQIQGWILGSEKASDSEDLATGQKAIFYAATTVKNIKRKTQQECMDVALCMLKALHYPKPDDASGT